MLHDKPKTRFDILNEDHVKLYKEFLKTRRWPGGCPFKLEYPYLSIPDMIKDRLIHHFLKV